MKTKNLFLILITLMGYMHLSAQNAKTENYFVTAKKDTTFCKELSYYTTGQGYLKEVEYTDLSGKKIKLKGKSNLPDVVTFCIKGNFIDKTPLKADKPDSYIRYSNRVVDGKLKVYLGEQGYLNPQAFGTNPGDPNYMLHGPSGIYRFYLKMPNGTYYKINDKGNLNNYIKPYLLKCEAFKNQYKGDYSTKEQPFMETIKLYNSLCP